MSYLVFMRITPIFLSLLVLSTFAATKTSIAVSDLEARGMTKDDGSIISDRLREELLNTGVFRVMERSVMDQILREQSFQQSGACTGSDCQVQVGRLLGVDRLVIGSVGKLGTLYTLSIRMLNVETGEIEQSFSQDHQGAIEDLVRGPIRSVAAKLAWAISSQQVPKVTVQAPAPQASLTETSSPVVTTTPAPVPVAPAPTPPAPAPIATPPQAKPAPHTPPTETPLSPLEIGIRLHFGATKVSGDKQLEKIFGENDAYFQFGGEIRLNLGSISLMPEILYTHRALKAEFKDSEGFLDVSLQTNISATYLSFPFLFGYNFSRRVQVFCGPALDFMTSNKIETSWDAGGSDSTITKKNQKEFNDLYASMILGGGLRFGDFVVDLRFQIPFAAAYKKTLENTDTGNTTEVDGEVKFSNWALALGYLF